MAIKFKITHGTYSAEGDGAATIHCNGKKLRENIVIACEEATESDKCVFYLNFLGTILEFEFTEGQTWYQYCGGADSGTAGALFYCTQVVFYAGNYKGEYAGSGLEIEYDSNGNDVTPSTVIEKGVTYVVPINGGGGSN
jgi:hypothetical protein